MRILFENFYNFDHDKVKKQFEGDLEYIATFSVCGAEFPVAVYRNYKPDRSKKHKDYLLLWVRNPSWCGIDPVQAKGMVAGMDQTEMDKYRFRTGIHCLNCDTVAYSMYRHDNRPCECGNCHIDGGGDEKYIKYNTKDKNYMLVKLDLIRKAVTRPHLSSLVE